MYKVHCLNKISPVGTALLTEQVRTKLMNKCVTAVVTEAFINALPFDKKELAKESASIVNYATNVIGKMHPETLLDRAMESTKYDQQPHFFHHTYMRGNAWSNCKTNRCCTRERALRCYRCCCHHQ